MHTTRVLACTLTCYVQGTVMCVRVCTHDYKCLQSKERVLEPPRAGVISSCELPKMGAGNRTRILCKSSAYF